MGEQHGNQLTKIIYSAIRFLCALVFMSQSTVVLWPENTKPDSESTDYVNLLKNGGFETAKENEPTYPTDWTYDACGGVPGKWKLTKPGHEGEQCGHLWSDKPGYHGGAGQSVTLEGNRRYKLSAWIKANISKGGKVTLLYYDCGRIDFVQDRQRTNKWWGGSAGEKQKNFDWQYVEKTFETPAIVVQTFNAKMHLVLFSGQADVWMDDARLVDLGPAKMGKAMYSMSFDDPKLWKLSAHVNETPAELPEGVKIQGDDKHMCEGKPGLILHYLFSSPRHDAIMLTADVSICGGTLFAFRVYGDGSGHELDAVLFDKSGEAHYLPIGQVYWRGWKTMYTSITDLSNGPASKWDVSCNHWGGDGNQTMEFSITRIAIGLNDQPDKFQHSHKD